MTVYISLLRGINVGGNKKIKMADLQRLYESLGLAGAKTLLQSGNVVFSTERADGDALKREIEMGIEGQFGFQSAVMLRTREQFQDVVTQHPFSEEQLNEPGRALVMFLASEPTADAIKALRQGYSGPEALYFRGQELYVYYTDGMGRSKLTNAVIEKKLKTLGTGRNWNTVTKLLALAEI